MSNTATKPNPVLGVVTNVEVKGPFDRKDGKGQYAVHAFYVNGEEYSKFAGTDDATEATVGDAVQILYDAQTYKDRFNNPKVNNKIIKMTKTDTESETKANKTSKATTETNNTTTTKYFTAKDESIVTQSVIKAVSGMLEPLSITDIKGVKALVKELTNLCLEPYNKQ